MRYVGPRVLVGRLTVRALCDGWCRVRTGVEPETGAYGPSRLQPFQDDGAYDGELGDALGVLELNSCSFVTLAGIGERLSVGLVVVAIQSAHVAAEPSKERVDLSVGCRKALVCVVVSVEHVSLRSGTSVEPSSLKPNTRPQLVETTDPIGRSPFHDAARWRRSGPTSRSRAPG